MNFYIKSVADDHISVNYRMIVYWWKVFTENGFQKTFNESYPPHCSKILIPCITIWPDPCIYFISFEFEIFGHLNRLWKLSTISFNGLESVCKRQSPNDVLAICQYIFQRISKKYNDLQTKALAPIFSLNSDSINFSPYSSIKCDLEILLVPVQNVAMNSLFLGWHLTTKYYSEVCKCKLQLGQTTSYGY